MLVAHASGSTGVENWSYSTFIVKIDPIQLASRLEMG